MSLKERLGFSQEPLYLMDGTAFLYRGFFANANMSRSDGLPTGALYIVGRVLLKLLREEHPARFAFIMDGHGPNFRHEIYSDYKANRPAAPDNLISQIDPVRRMVKALGLHLEVSDGCEADDCIASLVKRFSPSMPVVIIGSDKDLKQCLKPNVVLWDPSSKEEKLVTLDSFTAETGLAPEQWPDVQALIGDSSDNIPGVRGIGPKTAMALFKDFHSLEDLRDRIDQAPAKSRDKLAGNLDAMFLYRRLTTLDTNCCPDINLHDFQLQPIRGSQIQTLFREYEMNHLQRELWTMAKNGDVTMLPAERDQNIIRTPSAPVQLAFDSMAQAPQPSFPELTTAGLPPCHKKTVGMAPLPASMQLRHGPVKASPEYILGLKIKDKVEQFHYTGDQAELAAWLTAADCIVIPDVKKMLRQDRIWWDLAPDKWFDLAIAAYLLAPEDRDYGWPRLSARQADKHGISPFNAGELALSLYRDLISQLEHSQLLHLFKSMELPLIPVLASMELAGIKVDLAALNDFLSEVQNNLDRLTKEIYAAAGGEFNIRSAQQIGEVLYNRLGLPTAKSTRGGQASTSQDVLEKLSGRHPVVDNLLEFRKLEKLRSTYLEPLPRLSGADGRIHTSFNQTATATGRLSSSNPNLQNIPVRGPLGKRMRSCFTAEQGNMLISADYSQIELRVMAHHSQDPSLIAAFHNKEDIHTRTAALLNDIEPAQVTPDQRRQAKTINFGLIYGMGARKLANELSIPQSRAKEFIERYFERFAKIKAFYDQVEEQARKQGYVITLAGRRRPLPDMYSENAQDRALAERQAVNTMIQGSAADIIKLAMLAVYNDPHLKSRSARLLLQVHDELVLEVPAQHAAAVGERLAALMTDLSAFNINLSVPLAVDWSFGPSWGDAH